MKNLNDTKEDFIQSMRDMLERDSKIDVCLEKTDQINVAAVSLKKKSITVNKQIRRRNICLRVVGPLIILTLVALIVWWLITKFKS